MRVEVWEKERKRKKRGEKNPKPKFAPLLVLINVINAAWLNKEKLGKMMLHLQNLFKWHELQELPVLFLASCYAGLKDFKKYS